MIKKLKSFLADDALFFALLLVLVGLVSFGLGRQSVLVGEGARPAPSAPAGVIFTDVPATDFVLENGTTADVPVVASRSGSKYHLPKCPGALQIKEENKLYFDSTAEAEAAGYTPAANCPGLQ